MTYKKIDFLFKKNPNYLSYLILLAGLENRNNWQIVLTFWAIETQELNVSH